MNRASLIALGVGLLLAGAGGGAVVMAVVGDNDDPTTGPVVTTGIDSVTAEPDIEGFISFCDANRNASTPTGPAGSLESSAPTECEDFYEWESQNPLVSRTEYPGHIPSTFTKEAGDQTVSPAGTDSQTTPGDPGQIENRYPEDGDACAAVQVTPNTDDTVSNINVNGISCDEASALLLDWGQSGYPGDGPPGFSCEDAERPASALGGSTGLRCTRGDEIIVLGGQ